MDGVEGFCERLALPGRPLDTRSAAELFASIADDERTAFFSKWASVRQPAAYFAYVVTSASTYAKRSSYGGLERDRDGERLQETDLCCLISQDSMIPIFYAACPGLIAGRARLAFMSERGSGFGSSVAVFVTDRAFCNKNIIDYLEKNSIGFIMAVDSCHKPFPEAIDSVRNDLNKMKYRLEENDIAGIPVPVVCYGHFLTLYVYFKPLLAESDKCELYMTIKEEEEYLAKITRISKQQVKALQSHFDINVNDDKTFSYSRNEDSIEAIANSFGIHTILTNTDYGTMNVLDVYRRREMIERNFADIKSNEDLKSFLPDIGSTANGKMFCAFISLILISEIENRLCKLMKEKSWAARDVINELDKIQVLTSSINKRRLMNPLTETQRLILEPFGLSADDLNAYIAGA
jgi:hypothetical protein